MKQWEYLVVPEIVYEEELHRLRSNAGAEELDKLGAHGWEMVAAYNGRLYFKRPTT